MKQVLQNYSTGALELAEVPVPLCGSNKVLVKNVNSIISIGTERSVIELGRKSLLGKARTRPDLLKRFVEKARNEGFIKTFKTGLEMMDTPTSLGYSSAGIIIEVGNNIHKFSPGDRVACIGASYASHAEYIAVPEMLCTKIPLRKVENNRYHIFNKGEGLTSHTNCIESDYISFEEASFGMLGIIALHGIRCAKLTFGESVAIIGLGLLGLLTVQILKAYGCKVIGVDIDSQKATIAKTLGADYVFTAEDDFKNCIEKTTNGYGADAVIITATSKSSTPVATAVDVSRYGGKVVIVGVTDIHPQRNEMWHKEVEIMVSKAGGPGTFDPFFENKAIDYPIGHVRWTENRNLEEFLRLIAEGRVNVKPLISHKFKIAEAEKMYKELLNNRGGPYIGIVFEYPQEDSALNIIGNKTIKNPQSITHHSSPKTSKVSVGVIGAGLFGKALLLPALKKIPFINLDTIVTSSSANSQHTAKKYGFEKYSTDYREVLANNNIESVIILTPHSMHAKMVIEALKAGKHTFVEKPLCVGKDELDEIIETYNFQITTSHCLLMVGYNRRFSPHSVKVADYLVNSLDPMVINYRINAGFVSPTHWVHSEEEGGSRIVGEICHFVDMIQFLTKSNPVRVFGERIAGNNKTSLNSDNVIITLKCENGSVGNITYSASGDKAYSREQIELFLEGKTVVMEDYKKTSFHYSGKTKTFKTFNQEMGYTEELMHFFDAIKGKTSLAITPQEIFLSTLSVFKICEAIEKGQPMPIENSR